MKARVLYSFFGLLLLSACVSFYELNYEFNRNFELGNIQEAANLLDKNKKMAKDKTRFLYCANKGIVNHLLGDYEESNKWLEEAYIFGEDYQKNYLTIASSFLLNPNITVYPGEDHEHLLLLYYKALNYLKMDDYDAALIECRRLNLRLYELGDKYVSENKYQKDAFIQNLMGIVYDASGDYNNAFIAYRNSLEVYQNEYTEMFGLSAPYQLKKDLMRTASLAGFSDELDQYEKEFEMTYEPTVSEGGDLVFFWHNGLAPIKDEWSINFVAVEGKGGVIIFSNDELGFVFPFFYDWDDDSDIGISDLSNTRIAFPQYIERPPLFHTAQIKSENIFYQLEKAEDINAIAFKTLRERMLEELGKGLLRVALKKIVEKQVSNESESLGSLIGIVNFASEQADTRNWQTIPHSVHYTRVPLKEGINEIEFIAEGSGTENLQMFDFEGEKGKTQFQTYQSLESIESSF